MNKRPPSMTRVLCAVVVTCLTPTAAHAQSAPWRPDQTVEISAATAPGGGADRTARFIQRLAQEKKLIAFPFVVVNKPGGGGGIGLRYLNQHAGNGHYLQIYSPNVLAGYIVGQVPMNYTEVTPIAILYSEHMLVAVRVDSPVKNGRDLIERLRQDPKSLSMTVGIGLGNMNHIGAALPLHAGGVDVKAVKAVVFNTIAESVTAVVGGHIDIVAATPSTVLSQVQAGRLRVLGITAPQRVRGLFAQVPTWREQGIDSIASFWHGVIGPAGMTPAQVAYWEDLLATLAASDEWKAQMEQNYLTPQFMKSAQSASFLRAQYQELRSILVELGMAK
ncbi:MAG TPA: tripartite tricarboxylate transporter substrate binding protein [Burkholderiales bacterium]|jgi:putative tricarboxylic transport membrane protein|nr:tripartite tricarboxylate transporter substrate binding protein [Burkholderiales bacterium]